MVVRTARSRIASEVKPIEQRQQIVGAVTADGQGCPYHIVFHGQGCPCHIGIYGRSCPCHIACRRGDFEPFLDPPDAVI